MREDKRRLFWPVIILAAFVLIGLFYRAAIPPFEGPDEPEHFAYVTWLAAGKGFPPQGRAAWETPVRQEGSQPPLYYLMAALPATLVDVTDPPAVYRPNPHFPSPAPGHIPDNKNIAIHYPSDTEPLRGGWLALSLARTVSLLWGVVLLIAIYGLMRQVQPGRPEFAPLAMGLVALTPQVLFLSQTVSNDIAAAATGALTLWALAWLVRHGLSPRRALLLGVAYGVATLTKSSALGLGLPIAAGLGWLWWSRRSSFRQLLSGGLWLTLAFLLVAGWWYLRSWWLYGSPLGLETHCYAPWAFCDGASGRAGSLAEWREVFDSFWAAFGWGNIKFPGWVYGLWAAVLLPAMVGLGRLIWHSLSGRDRGDGVGRALVGLLFLAVLSNAAALEVWMRQVRAPHGRLLFPSLAAVALLLVLGWSAFGRRGAWLGVAGAAALALASLLYLIRPAYALPEPLTAADLARRAGPQSLGWTYADFAELHSVSPQRPSATAGQSLPVQICWYALERAAQDYSLLVHLVGPQNQVVAGRHTYPGLGSYPTRAWEPGYRFCDLVRIDIPAELSQTLQYQIEVGWIDSATGERLPAVGSDGVPRGHTFAASVRLETAAPSTVAPPPEGTEMIRLADYELSSAWQAGEPSSFVLRWWLAEALSTDYTTFVHLRDPATGQNVAQADGPPLDGWYPTSSWEPGELVVDRRHFPLPAELGPGKYDLVVGWYDPATGARLGDEHRLGAVEVQP